MYGWAGAILWVDLTAGNVSKRPLERELAESYLGGRGINSRLLFQLRGWDVATGIPTRATLEGGSD